MMLSCPATLYQSHLTSILTPLFEHIQYRLQCSWDPIIRTGATDIESTKPLISDSCADAANKLASSNMESWLLAYYARAGLFVGDLDGVTAEAAVEKARVELTRTFADVIQSGESIVKIQPVLLCDIFLTLPLRVSVLALKGSWALVLANKAKEEQAIKRNDPSKLTSGPRNQISQGNGIVNADGKITTTYFLPFHYHLALTTVKML